jgi:3-phenylpropionate/trans-cinnamate dioxygenase ferredoxin subunit
MSTDYFPVAACDDLPIGSCRAFDVNGVKIVVAHLTDGYHAVENRCSHAGSPLLTGKIYRGNQIACPIHGARFDLKTGAAKSPPAFSSLKVFPVRAVDGRVEVAVPQATATA